MTQIYKTSHYIDPDFIKYGLQRGFMTLRMGDDKTLFLILTSNNNVYKKSLCHKIFFNDIMDFNIKDTKNFDKNMEIIVTSFPSHKHGFDMEIFKNVKNK